MGEMYSDEKKDSGALKKATRLKCFADLPLSNLTVGVPGVTAIFQRNLRGPSMRKCLPHTCDYFFLVMGVHPSWK